MTEAVEQLKSRAENLSAPERAAAGDVIAEIFLIGGETTICAGGDEADLRAAGFLPFGGFQRHAGCAETEAGFGCHAREIVDGPADQFERVGRDGKLG